MTKFLWSYFIRQNVIYKLFIKLNINKYGEIKMTSEKKKEWFGKQRCVSIRDEVHDNLTKVRDLYIKRYHRNIALGNIIELLLLNDAIITALYNEVI